MRRPGPYFRLADRALEVLHRITPEFATWRVAQAQARRYSGDLAGAFAILESEIAQTELPSYVYLRIAADIASLQGNFKAARNYLERLCPGFARPEFEGEGFRCRQSVDYAYVLQRLGEAERADRVLAAYWDDLQDRPRFGVYGYGIADVQTLALMGRPTEALARLREAMDAGWRSSWTVNALKLSEDPYLAELRDDPEFRDMVAEVEADIARMRDRAMQAEASGKLGTAARARRSKSCADRRDAPEVVCPRGDATRFNFPAGSVNRANTRIIRSWQPFLRKRLMRISPVGSWSTSSKPPKCVPRPWRRGCVDLRP